MSRFLAILFVLIISVQSVHQGFIYAYFVLNKDYIAQNLCENKTKPALKCDGKCHLRQVLSINKKEATPEQAPVPHFEELKAPVLFFQEAEGPSARGLALANFAPSNSAAFSYLFDYKYVANSSIYRPPKA